MSQDSVEIWNQCLDGDCPGVGGRHMNVLITFHGQVENGGLLNAVESVREDEADGDAEYSLAEVSAAYSWAGFSSVTEQLNRAGEAVKTLDDHDDEELERLETSLDDAYLKVVDEDELTRVLEERLVSHPEEFAAG